MPSKPKPSAKSFSTRVFPSFPSLLPISVVAPSVALVVLPFMSDFAAITVGLVITAVIYALVILSSPVIAVTAGAEPELQVGRAAIPLRFVKHAEILTGDALKFEKGPGLNAKAYFVNQAGIKTFVKMNLSDPEDPTPYWLFACKRPEDLVIALGANR